jgi:hypothetical protein
MKLFLFIFSWKVFALDGVLNNESIQEDLDQYLKVQIEQNYPQKKMATIIFKKSWQLYPKQWLKLVFSTKQHCQVQILSLDKNRGYVDTSQCPYHNKISTGQLLHHPPLKISYDQTYTPETYKLKQIQRHGFFPSKNESWYLYTAVGLSPINYDQTIQEAIDTYPGNQNANPGLYLEPVGFYFPIFNHQALLGVVSSFILDFYKFSGDFEETETTTVTQYADLFFLQYSVQASLFYFLGKNIGHGFFFRGDVGLSSFWGNLEVSYSAKELPPQGQNQAFSYNPGLTALLGIGLALPISLDTRLLFNLNFQLKNAVDREDATIYSNHLLGINLALLL